MGLRAFSNILIRKSFENQILADHKAIICTSNENYNNKSYQSCLSRWADRLLPFDFKVIHVPGVLLGIVDYLSCYSTFPAPQPSQYDELFVVKSIEAFNKAVNFINSAGLSERRVRSRPQEGVASVMRDCYIPPVYRHFPVGGVDKITQRLNQSNRLMQICQSNSSSIEGDELCSVRADHSNTSMLIKTRNHETLAQEHCLRPETSQNSSQFMLSLQISKNLSHIFL